MNFMITLYNSTLDWLERHEKIVLGFVLGVISFTVLLLLLNAHWVAAGLFTGLTVLNFYINRNK
jgi:O-antigen/teichoic acid export membrane protein